MHARRASGLLLWISGAVTCTSRASAEKTPVAKILLLETREAGTMAADEKSGLRSVQITGRQLGRITATELIGGEMCRITLERDEHGRYREVSWTPIHRAGEARDPRTKP